MTTSIQNKIDFCLIFKVKNANPNGDPLNGNRPRQNYDGLGEVSDVCLKRKIRNRLLSGGESIFVQSDDNKIDEARSLRDRYDKAGIKEKKDKYKIVKEVCEKWLDVRTFGQVFAFAKAAKNGDADNSNDGVDSVSTGVRGPVSIQPAFSVEPVNIVSNQITKSVNGETTKDGKKASDTIGQKHRIDNAVYATFGSINCQLAEKTGFGDKDADKIKEALRTIFRDDVSSARPDGSMEVIKLIWIRHNCKIGQYSSAKVHNSISVKSDGKYEIAKLQDLKYEELDGE